MDEKQRLIEKLVKANAKDKDGKLTLSCSKAFELADVNDVTLLELAAYCNAQGVKIVRCQLGCFP